jgi:hypothetical protein
MLRITISETIAALIYWPLARVAALLPRLGVLQQSPPLSWYNDKSCNFMRTDAYDRFCTRLEKRFTKIQIDKMLTYADFDNLGFSDQSLYWCAVGIKSRRRLAD